MPLRISHSQIKMWNQCRRKWWFAHAAKLTRDKHISHLTWGKVWGRVCDLLWIEWVETGRPPRNREGVEAIVDIVFSPLIAVHEEAFSVGAYDEKGDTIDCWPTLDETLEHRRHMVFLAMWYINTWRRQGLEPEELITEFPIEIPLTSGEDPPLFIGYVDKMVKSRGMWVVIDHKSTSIGFDRWLETHQYDSQISMYAAALERLGYEVSHQVWDLVSSDPPPRLDDFKLIKNGKRLSYVWPKGATHGMVLKAIHHHGFNPDDYKSQLEELKAKGRPAYSWIQFNPVDPIDVRRTWQELIGFAEDIGRDFNMANRELIATASESGDLDTVIANLTSDSQVLRAYPRNRAACYHFNRPCMFASACHHFDTSELTPMPPHEGREGDSMRVRPGCKPEPITIESDNAESE